MTPLSRAVAAVTSMTEALEIRTAADAEAQVVIFNATFWAVVSEAGLAAAADAMSASFEVLVASIKASGFGSWLGPLGPTETAMSFAVGRPSEIECPAAIAILDGIGLHLPDTLGAWQFGRVVTMLDCAACAESGVHACPLREGQSGGSSGSEGA